jgi:deferrochelatase/peroxidase EfeB
VPGFRDFVVAQAAKVTLSSGEQVTPALLGAKLVGRYESGCPLALTKDQPTGLNTQKADPSVADPSMLTAQKINNFDFADSADAARDDTSGKVVPRAAHIRKVYPRNSEPPGEAIAEAKRILRRGVAFGLSFDKDEADGPSGPNPPFPDDRGLLFLCYQQSIQGKFEFLMRRWVNNPDFPEAKDGFDLVISQSQATRSFSALELLPPSFEADARWVTTTFGEYFFQPSISALLHLAGAI